MAVNFWVFEAVKVNYELDATSWTNVNETWSLTLHQEWRQDVVRMGHSAEYLDPQRKSQEHWKICISFMICIPGQELLVLKWRITWAQHVANRMEKKCKVSIGKPRGTCKFEHRQACYERIIFQWTLQACIEREWNGFLWHMRGMRHDSFEHSNGNTWVPYNWNFQNGCATTTLQNAAC